MLCSECQQRLLPRYDIFVWLSRAGNVAEYESLVPAGIRVAFLQSFYQTNNIVDKQTHAKQNKGIGGRGGGRENTRRESISEYHQRRGRDAAKRLAQNNEPEQETIYIATTTSR